MRSISTTSCKSRNCHLLHRGMPRALAFHSSEEPPRGVLVEERRGADIDSRSEIRSGRGQSNRVGCALVAGRPPVARPSFAELRRDHIATTPTFHTLRGASARGLQVAPVPIPHSRRRKPLGVPRKVSAAVSSAAPDKVIWRANGFCHRWASWSSGSLSGSVIGHLSALEGRRPGGETNNLSEKSSGASLAARN